MSGNAPPPTYEGPEPIRLPQLAKPPDYPGASGTPSGVHRVVSTVAEDVSKMKRASRYKMYGAVGTLLITALGGGKLAQAKGESQETTNRTHDLQILQLAKDHSELKTRVDAGERAQRKTERKVDRIEIMVELELKKHGIDAPPRVDDAEE